MRSKHRNKIAAIGLLAGLLLYPLPPVSAQEEAVPLFSDVSDTHWAYTSLEKLVKKYGLNLGYPDGSFQGNRTLTRYEVAALLAQVLDNLPAPQAENPDVAMLKSLVQEYGEDLKLIKTRQQDYDQILQKLAALEAQNTDQGNALNEILKKLTPSWSGTISARYNLITPMDISKASANSPQLQLNLGLNNKADEVIGYGVRLAVGAPTFQSATYVNLGDFSSKLAVSVDRLFLSYRPAKFLDFTVGKFADPFANSQIFYDVDVNHQGLLEKMSLKDITPWLKEWNLALGQIVFNMDSTFGQAFQLAGKTGVKMDLTDFLSLDLRAGYYHYMGEHNLFNANKIAQEKNLPLRFTGNQLRNTGNHGFSIANGFAMLTFKLSEDWPLSLSGDYFYNLAAPVQNQGFQASVKLGKNYFIGYNFKFLEADATFSPFVEESLGGTDLIAHEAVLGFKPFPQTTVMATAQMQNRLSVTADTVYVLRGIVSQSF
ncbi:MAG: putative porin [Candidatus Sericytochromatia bacterium]